MIDAAGLQRSVDVEVDGGIGPDTVAGAVAAGANVLVAGSRSLPRSRRARPRGRRPAGARPMRARHHG